jgi:hypothetical protein
MDSGRKYQQRGYQDSEREARTDRPTKDGPRPPIDVTGPRLPRLVQAVTAMRCYNCGTALAHGVVDFKGTCPKCQVALHCCKQCSYFEPSTRFQCRKPIPIRIAVKDAANECELFAPRVTVARDSSASSGPAIASNVPAPRTASDARAAFDQLFKK